MQPSRIRAGAGGSAERRGAAGELPEVRARRGDGKHSGAGDNAGFCFSSFALLALYFAAFLAFPAFPDKFISRAAFFENRRQICGLLALC